MLGESDSAQSCGDSVSSYDSGVKGGAGANPAYTVVPTFAEPTFKLVGGASCDPAGHGSDSPSSPSSKLLPVCTWADVCRLAMRFPILVAEFRGSLVETCPYLDKATGRRSSFERWTIAVEYGDPVLQMRITFRTDGPPLPAFAKGQMIVARILTIAVEKASVTATGKSDQLWALNDHGAS